MRLWLGLASAVALTFGVPGLDSCGSGNAAFAAQAKPGCCKVCRKGKACGDSCISENKTCHKGSGCACDG